VDDKLVVLIEHMSTISENLPLRLLLYISRVYEKIINRKAVYRQELMKIPTPELIVLYNGKSKYPDNRELRLSNAFKEVTMHREKYGNLELTVRVLNINVGHNEHLIQQSSTLFGYVTFINEVRKGVDDGLELSSALKAAVSYCESKHILQPFLQNHSSEVENMLTTEFNMDDAIEVWIEEGHEKGLKKGLTKGRREGLTKGRKDMAKKLKALGILSNTQIAEISGLSIAEIEKL
jgi:predicted transposase/invertase (TIGR01784 family)